MTTTESVKYKEAGLHWLGLPPVAWSAEVDKLTSSEKQDLSNWLNGVIQRAARLSGYLDARGVTGCGDNGHEDGVKKSNRQAAKIRKALGFTYPKQDLRF